MERKKIPPAAVFVRLRETIVENGVRLCILPPFLQPPPNASITNREQLGYKTRPWKRKANETVGKSPLAFIEGILSFFFFKKKKVLARTVQVYSFSIGFGRALRNSVDPRYY